jgi:hypothetical protein
MKAQGLWPWSLQSKQSNQSNQGRGNQSKSRKTRGKVAVKKENDTGRSSKRTRGKVAVKEEEEEEDTGSSSKRTLGKVAVKEEEDTSGPGVDEMEEDGDSDDSDGHRHRSDRAYPEDLEKNMIAYLNKIFAQTGLNKRKDIPWRLSENVLLSITGSKIRTENPTEGHWPRAVVQKPPRFPGIEITWIPTDIRERLALNHGHYFGGNHYNDRVDGPWNNQFLPCM